ncbi:hypothetical protein [Streptosporangium saharense]|uniref:hypothetical protein n=1 Tax=Streptosporangium saharense TaxID=1706840 RepID=UPI003325A589
MTRLSVEAISAVSERAVLYDRGDALAGDAERFARTISSFGTRFSDISVLRDGQAVVTDLALRAVDGLGHPYREETLVFVQSGHDQDHLTVPLPRIAEELSWPVREDLAVTHLEQLGGTAVFDLLQWLLAPDGQAAVLLTDRPELAFHGDAVPTGAVVALRVRPGDGPLRVLDWGEGAPAVAERTLTATGPVAPWLRLLTEITTGRLAPGTRVVLATGPTGRRGWALIELADPIALGATHVIG